MAQRPSITISRKDKVENSQPVAPRSAGLSTFLNATLSKLHDWKHSFALLDTSNKGSVTKVELQMAFRRHGQPLTHSETIFAEYASEGCFNYRRFLSDIEAHAPKPSLESLERLRAKLNEGAKRQKLSPTMIFLQIDRNNNGLVSVDELYYYFRGMGVSIRQTELQHLVAQFTSRVEGLNYKEFSEMFWGKLVVKEDGGQLFDELAILLLNKQFDLYSYFCNADERKIGFFDRESFAAAISGILATFSRGEADMLFDVLDVSKIGRIHYKALGAVVKGIDLDELTDQQNEVLSVLLEELFDDHLRLTQNLQAVDKDKDGKLTFEELSGALLDMGVSQNSEKLRPIFSMVAGNSQLISIEQFVNELQRRVWMI